ncbi:MAG: type II toxin-antitoxin system RelE/ParE family toxin [Candidatus Aureabacteria bacterium]|nr:type II toxin-antitoxin system RelE/ParE family toxin [Candidatus Auribacterota bacterium]
MEYSVSYHPEIHQDISSIPQNIKLRIKKAIEQRLLIDPLKFGEPLRRSLQGFRKLRVGDYRIIYKIKKEQITILKIGHRKEVYKKERKE